MSARRERIPLSGRSNLNADAQPSKVMPGSARSCNPGNPASGRRPPPNNNNSSSTIDSSKQNATSAVSINGFHILLRTYAAHHASYAYTLFLLFFMRCNIISFNYRLTNISLSFILTIFSISETIRKGRFATPDAL